MADYHYEFLTFFAKWAGIADGGLAMTYRGVGELSDYLNVDKHTYRQAKLAFRQGGHKRWMPVFPGARQLTLALRKLGVEIWVTTTRPYLRMDNIDPDTREWLRRNGIVYDHIFYDEDKYKKLLEFVDKDRIVAVLEDEPSHVYEAQVLDLPVIWRVSQYNEGIRAATLQSLGAVRWVRSLPEAQEEIATLTERWKRKHD